MKYFIIRSLVILSLWIPLFVWVLDYSTTEIEKMRFESLLLSNGRVSSLQRESVFSKPDSLKPGDRILRVGGLRFEPTRVKKWLNQFKSEDFAPIQYVHKGSVHEGQVFIRNYNKRDLLLFLILPLIVSFIFLGFSIVTPFPKSSLKRSREAVEVFSLLCLGISVFFLLFFPSVTFGIVYPGSLIIPLLGAMIFHLCQLYPKKKGGRMTRSILILSGYFLASLVMASRVQFWFQSMPWWFYLLDIAALGLFLSVAMASLGNTLFTSKDFWARRRARLLSLGFLISFVALVSVFVTFLWEGPRVSLERVLGFSALFPVFFAFIISKENVFDLERIFKRGMHQFLFLSIAVTLASLVGLGWQQWAEAQQSDWLLWAVIAMSVALFSRPVGAWAEKRISRLVTAKVRYPHVGEIFEKSLSLEDFLSEFSAQCEKQLNMKNIHYRFFKDPTRPWSDENEQQWAYKDNKLVKVYLHNNTCYYFSSLKRGDIKIGEVAFSGGDSLAFDPVSSFDWESNCQSLSRCIELVVLREFLSSQQGLLAVGRMQALLAHEMKNPLAVVKVCSGLLQHYIDDSDEADEILKTIQQEVERVSAGVQNIFNHSGRGEKKEKVDVYSLIEKIKESALARFGNRQFEVKLYLGKNEEAWEPGALWMWTEKEGLRQSLVNLIVNAYEAGSSWVGVDVIIRPKQHLRILVKDRGPGIPKEIELFKPFVSTKANGTGLGLSHVKAFVDRHSGRIQVHSHPNQGSSFVMEFSTEYVVE